MSFQAAPESLARLRRAKGFIFDMDGTLVMADASHQSAEVLPGAAAMLQAVVARDLPFVVFTNGTVKPPAALAEVLRGAGLPVAPHQVMTPSTIAADMLRRRGVKRVMMMGAESGRAPLRDAGLEVVGSRERRPVDAVYVAWYRDFTMDDLENAARAIWDGAVFLAGSLHPFYMTAQGRAIGTSRAIAAAITSLTGKRPTLTGKPSLVALRQAASRLRVKAGDVVVVGDDAGLEMAMARRGGALGVLVQTGVTGAVAAEALPAAHRGDFQLAGIDDLLSLWED